MRCWPSWTLNAFRQKYCSESPWGASVQYLFLRGGGWVGYHQYCKRIPYSTVEDSKYCWVIPPVLRRLFSIVEDVLCCQGYSLLWRETTSSVQLVSKVLVRVFWYSFTLKNAFSFISGWRSNVQARSFSQNFTIAIKSFVKEFVECSGNDETHRKKN